MTPLARDLAARGIAAWNIEYRRVGQEGGGWPGTLEDAAAAADAVVGLEGVDATRVVTVGHSAGGQLALWLAGRHRLPAGALGADPRLRPCGAVSQAGVGDLVAGAASRPRRRRVPGAPRRRARRRPGALRGRLARGAAAARRPAAARPRRAGRHRAAGAEPGLRRGGARRPATRSISSSSREADHFDVIEAADPAWAAVVDWLRERCAWS